MMIDTCYDTGYALPDTWHCAPGDGHVSHGGYYQYPGQYECDMVKEEPCSPSWSRMMVSSLDLPPLDNMVNTTSSPMIMSPCVSNLNTPRVSISSHGGSVVSDLGARIRSSHSSLHSDPDLCPVTQPSSFGHSLQSLATISDPNKNFCVDHEMLSTNYTSSHHSR